MNERSRDLIPKDMRLPIIIEAVARVCAEVRTRIIIRVNILIDRSADQRNRTTRSRIILRRSININTLALSNVLAIKAESILVIFLYRFLTRYDEMSTLLTSVGARYNLARDPDRINVRPAAVGV